MICDRFTDSTRVYQGELGDVDAQLIRALERVTVGDLRPDLTFILDVPAEIGLARAAQAARRRGEPTASRARRSNSTSSCATPIRELAEREPERCVLIDASRDRAPRSPIDLGRRSTSGSIPPTAPLALEDARIVSAATTTTTTTSRIRARPRALFGHAEAEQALLDAYRSGRMPHAWLIGGPPGIGKATLAYRMARFVLAHPDPAAPRGAGRRRRSRSPPTIRRRAAIAAQAHPDLLVLERTVNEKTGKLRTVIRVDDVRRTVVVLRLDRGRGRLARLHRRRRRRAQRRTAPTRC